MMFYYKEKRKTALPFSMSQKKAKYVMQLTESCSDFPRACALNLSILNFLLANILWSKEHNVSCLVRSFQINHFNEYCYVKSPGKI